MLFTLFDLVLTSACLISEIYMCAYLYKIDQDLPTYLIIDMIISAPRLIQTVIYFYESWTLVK